MSDIKTTGFVSRLQHFSTGDGEGIRTTVFMQGCGLCCPWCHNPETIPVDGCTLHYDKGSPKRRTVISGENLTAGTVLDYILEDFDFYAESGGGVTLSGGEPLLQPEFCSTVAKLCFERGIDVIIDTAGNVPWSAFESVLPYVRRYLYDIKASSAEDYAKLGGDFDIITGNLTRLISIGKTVTVRIPIIPGFNSSRDYMESFVSVLRKCGVSNVELLPFHRLGSAKYTAMGLVYPYADTESLYPSEIEGCADVLRNAGFDGEVIR